MRNWIITLLQLLFTATCIFLFVDRLLSIWKLTVDAITLILLVLAALPWLLQFVERIDIPGVGKFSLNAWLKKPSKPDKLIKDVKIELGEHEIKFKDELVRPIKKWHEFISFRARINYEFEAGAAYLFQVKINDTYLKPVHAENKPKYRETADGRKVLAYDTYTESWKLVYSPDFVANYKHSKYKEISSDAYLFVFKIGDIFKGKDKIEIRFIHIGLEGHEAYKNSIIIRDIIAF